MKHTMTALRKTAEGPGHTELADIPVPEIGENEVLIKVHAAGICGTDLKIRAGKTWSNPPVTLGHELSGVIEKTGCKVTEYKPGDRVVSETAQIICGHCWYCKTGSYLMCPERLSIGYGTDGGMAEYIKVRKDIVHMVPDSVSLDEAALCEPTAVAVHAVYDSVDIKAGDIVLVLGCGAIGNLVAQIAKSFGATVIITGLTCDEKRLELARKVGIDYAVNTQTESVEPLLDKLTGKIGPDYVFDCSGAPAAIRMGMSLLKRKGTFVQVGLTQKNLEIEYSLLTGREIKIAGTFGHNWSSWETALKLMQTGKIDASSLITDRVALKDWEAGFASASSGSGLKVLIYPNQE